MGKEREKERKRKRETGRGGERERNTDWLPLVCTPTRDRTGNLDMCPDQNRTYDLSM